MGDFILISVFIGFFFLFAIGGLVEGILQNRSSDKISYMFICILILIYLGITINTYNKFVIDPEIEKEQLIMKEQNSFDNFGLYNPKEVKYTSVDSNNFITRYIVIKPSTNDIDINYDNIFPNSTASVFGFKPDDVLYKINGEQLKSLEHYKEIINSFNDGDTVNVRYSNDELDKNITRVTTFKSISINNSQKCDKHHSHSEEVI